MAKDPLSQPVSSCPALSHTHILKVISFSYIKRNCLPATWIQLFYKEKRNKILVRFLFFYSQHCIIIVVHFFLYRSNIIEFTFKIQLIRVSPALFFKILMEVKWPAKTFSDPCTCNITLHIGWLVGRFAQIESPWVCCFFLLHFFCFFVFSKVLTRLHCAVQKKMSTELLIIFITREFKVSHYTQSGNLF